MAVFDNIHVHDVFEVFVNDGTRDYFYGCVTGTGLEKTVDSELLRCGIGNKVRAKQFNSQDYKVNVTPLFHNDNIIAMQTGGAFVAGTKTLKRSFGAVAVDNLGDIEIDMTSAGGTPVGDAVVVLDKYNTVFVGTYVADVVTITGGVAGDFYTILWDEVLTGEALDLGGAVFPENVHLTLKGLGYDPDTNAEKLNIYWDFPIASPDGNLSQAYEVGTNSPTNIAFDILSNGVTGSYGTYFVEEI